MTWQGWLQFVVFAALITAVVKPLGGYIVRNVEGGGRVQRNFSWFERGLYRLAGVDPAQQEGWVDYALAIVWFNLFGIALLYALQRLQNLLPFNPQAMDAVSPDLALNTAVSFATNTSWQSYGGESTMSYLAQMTGLVVQSFLSAATGIAVAIALVRGFTRRSAATIGNFLGRSDPDHAVRAAAHVCRDGTGDDLAGRAGELRALCQCHDARRRAPGDRARTGCLTEGDRGAEW